MLEAEPNTLATADEIKRYEQSAADHDEKHGPYHAEMVPGIVGRWFVVNVLAGREGIPASHLVARRFGVYLPELKREWISRGKRHSRRVPLVPGYLFVFVWDIEKHMRRIRACPGVLRVMTLGKNYITVPDEDIARLQMIEFQEDWGREELQAIADDEAKAKAKADANSRDLQKLSKRRRRRRRVREETKDSHSPIITISVRNTLTAISHLADDERIGAFHKALGLGS